ncbi:MAG: hypothetical protein R2856_07620 [Caldilineaceae bacterium]
MPRIHYEFERAPEEYYPSITSSRSPSSLRYGSWMGGDRDNPTSPGHHRGTLRENRRARC